MVAQCCISATLRENVTAKPVLQSLKTNLLSPAGWITQMKKGNLSKKCPWFPETFSAPLKSTWFCVCINKCLEICTENKKDFDQKIAHILLCKELYREVLNLQKQLKEVSQGLERLQADDTTITASVEMWFDLINNKELEPPKNKIKKLFKDSWKLSIS